MSKRGSSSQTGTAAAAAAAVSENKKSRTDDGPSSSNAAAAAADPTKAASASSPSAHSGKVSHAHHGPLALTTASDQSLKYLPGFGCELQSEALPHALPVGQNSPQVSVEHCTCYFTLSAHRSLWIVRKLKLLLLSCADVSDSTLFFSAARTVQSERCAERVK